MDRRLIVSILFLLIIEKLGQVNGFARYKWVSLKLGDKLPENTVPIDSQGDVYVGRARHFDEILLAEIRANESALISSCHKEIRKEKFEVLTTLDECEWKSFSEIWEIDESVVRGGTAWDGEPIYIGVSTTGDRYSGFYYHIGSIYLARQELYHWSRPEQNNGRYEQPQWRYLSCNTTNTKSWIDSSSMKLPKNTVSGGASNEDYEMYVAQLKRGCDVVTGQVIPEMGIATAILSDGSAIEADYCQVLVGEPNEYTWVSASDGEIPDYAVANGKAGSQIAYVARVNKNITHLTHGQALSEHLEYDVLVANRS